jgi:hypothetical protein
MAISFKNIIAQLIFNVPLLSNPRNNLAGKRLMTQKFLATPLSNSMILPLGMVHFSLIILYNISDITIFMS